MASTGIGAAQLTATQQAHHVLSEHTSYAQTPVVGGTHTSGGIFVAPLSQWVITGKHHTWRNFQTLIPGHEIAQPIGVAFAVVLSDLQGGCKDGGTGREH